MPSSEMPVASGGAEVDWDGAGREQDRRYLPVTAVPADGDGSWFTFLVDCPRRGRVGLDACAACSDGVRLRFRRGKAPATIECKFTRVPEPAPKLRLIVRQPAEDAPESSTLALLLAPGCLCLTPNLGLNEVATLFRQRALRQAPVVDEARRPIGVLSHSDIVRALNRAAPKQALTVAYAMRRVPHTLPTNASLSQAMALVWDNGLDALVLTSPNGEVAGIVGEFELLARLASML